MELFRLLGKIAIENAEARKALKEVSQEGKETESKLSKTFGAIGKGAAVAGKAIGAGLVAGTTACVGLATAAIKSYSDYEQLVGGSKLLFGDAFGYIEEKAKNAYATVQMSTNEYLQQVNGFSTGLKTALGGNEQAAAELAHKIVVAEADIVAATGNSAENVQNAFNGIMKSNFTMLDNLQLGITPTKEGFQEVIDKVNDWNTANGEATSYQIDNLADCQSALVDYIEIQGLAGYASNEAAGTIQGSWGMLKGAWSNLLTGFVDPSQNISTLIQNVFTSVTTFANNLVEPISQVFVGIATALEQLVPQIMGEIPGLFNQILPPLIDGAVALVNGLVSALPSIINTLLAALPMLIDGLMSIVDALIGALPTILESIVNALPTLIPQLIDAAVNLFMMLVEMLPQIIQPIIDALPTIIVSITDALLSNLPVLISGVGQLIVALAAAIPQILGALWDAIKGVFSLLASKILGFFEPVKTAISNAWKAMGNVPGLAQLKTMIENVWKSIKDFITTYINAVKNIVTTVWNSIKNVISTVLNSIKNVIKTAWEAVKTIISNVMKLISSVLKGDWEGVKKAISNILNAIKSVIKSIWDGIKNTISSVLNGIKNVVSSVWNGIKSVISSYLNMIKTTVSSVWNGIKGAISNVLKGIVTTVKGGAKDMLSAGKDLVKGIWNGISGSLDWIKGKIKSWVGSVTKFIKKLFGIKSPSTVMRDEVGRELARGVAVGIEENTSEVEKAAEEMNQKVLDAAQKRIDDYKVYNDMTLAEEAGFWDEVRQQIAEGTDARIKADQKYLEAKKSVDEQVLDAEKTFSEKMVDAQTTLQEELDNIAKKVTDRQKSIMDSFELFGSFNPEESGFDASTELLLGLDAQINALEKYNSLIDNLEARIGGSALLDELKNMGVDSADKLQHIANMSDSDLQMYSKKYDEKLSLAGRMATEDTAEERAKLTEEAYRVYAESQKTAIDEIAETYNLIGVEIQGGTETLVSTLAPCMENLVEAFTTPLDEIRDAWSNTFGDLATGLEFSAPTLSKDSVVYSINSETADGNGNKKAETGTLSDVFASIVEQKNMTKKLIEMLAKFFPEMIEALDIDLYINGRQFATELAPDMDVALGFLSSNKERGR